MICERCVMDDTAKDFVMYGDGTCKYCQSAAVLLSTVRRKDGEWNVLKREILERPHRKPYDCVLGLSGGVDSSFALYLAVAEGLNPICVHFDNGWNSDEAERNVVDMAKRIDVDLEIFKVDVTKFKELQLAFLRAGVPDLEIPTDHIFVTILYRKAFEYGVKYIIAGSNLATESIVPRCWSKGHYDFAYIKDIDGRFGKRPRLSSYHFRTFRQLKRFQKSIKWTPILNYFQYNREDAKAFLIKRFSFQDSGSKHCDSVYTRFIQSYVLPKRFGFDKRKSYLSSLIVSGQMTREAAVEILKEKPYDNKLMSDDYTKILDGLGVRLLEFEEFLALPLKFYGDYAHYKKDCDTRTL